MSKDWQKVKNGWVKFGKPGDYIVGTFISARDIQSQLANNEGKMTRIYEIKADLGEFHDTDEKKNPIEPAVVIAAGEIWNVGGGAFKPGEASRSMIDTQMRNIKRGQKIKIQFTEERPSKTKGFAAMKVKKVFTNGEFDQEWLKEQENDAEVNRAFNAM